MFEKMKSDLQKQFDKHGLTIEFEKTVVTERNKLQEAIKTKSQTLNEKVVVTNQSQNFKDTEIGSLRSGGTNLILAVDTELTEKSIVRIDERSYSVELIEPVYVFGKKLCFLAALERADNHGRSV